MKRTVQVNVKMTQEDFELLKKAAEKRWPDAAMTKFRIIWTEQKRLSAGLQSRQTCQNTTASVVRAANRFFARSPLFDNAHGHSGHPADDLRL